jgi:beta-glucanase (GH16 family)
MIRRIALSVVFLLSTPLLINHIEIGPTPQPSSVPGNYYPVFQDEFEDVGLDLTKWQYRYPDKQYLAGFSDKASVVQPGDGYLHLITRFDGNKFLIGMVQSVEKFRYGYFEARIRFQKLQGHHGAFWLQSPHYGEKNNYPAQSGAEIDVVEYFGNGRTGEDAQHNVYWNAYKSGELQQRSHDLYIRRDLGVSLTDDFHTFSLLWTENEYTFFIDGIETWRTSEGVSQTAENIILSLVTSDWENSKLDKSQLPDEMLIDYVRVYAVEQG